MTRQEDIERRKNMKAVNEGERGEFRKERRKEAIQEIKDERAMIKAHAEMGIPYPHKQNNK